MQTPNNEPKEVAAPITSDKTLKAKNTSSNNQRAIILEALKQSPKTTVQLRHELGIMQPAPRVKELREQGHRINTVRIVSYTPDGIKHSAVAKYVLHTSSDCEGEVSV